MNCPGCKAAVPDGTSICPKCDFIIDSSFLGDLSAPPDEAPKKPQLRPQAPVRPAVVTGEKPAQRPSGTAPRTGPRPSARGAAPAARGPISRPAPHRPAPPPEPEPEDEVAEEPAPDWHVKPSAARAPEPRAKGMAEPEEVFAEAKDFVSGLGTSDKLAIAGAAVVILSCFFPWKVTVTEGEVIGLMSLGSLAFAAAVGTIVILAIRVRRLMPRTNPIFPWLVQLGATSFSTVWCLIFIKVSWDSRQVPALVGNYQMSISRPDWGLALGLIGGLLALGGTLMGLKEKPV